MEPGSSQLFHAERAYRDASPWALGVALLTALLRAPAVTSSLTRRLRRPLSELTTAAEDMSGGRYGTRVPDMGAGAEVDALAESFSTMAAGLERTEHVRRRMLSDLAHELRTPAAVLAVHLECLEDGVATFDGPTGAAMGEQLARLIEDIDDVSRAEEGCIVLERERVPLARPLHAGADAAREVGAERGVTLRVEAEPAGEPVAGTVLLARQRMGQVLANLLS